ncbi:spore germination protein [Anaeromicrobium sediminis]|uniref:Spore germination protein n=1 Tax=Anaeromicrobium sediminis TaxID=1478221 RepID=A0A267MF54_9FIRM|nr:spore germination protein [Anaeromicrobium sediminis]PAB58214.1 spore germination protein [Anaeromicrobium sediminis]
MDKDKVLSLSLKENIEIFDKGFNKDVTIKYRKFKYRNEIDCCLIYAGDMIDGETIYETILRPMQSDRKFPEADLIPYLIQNVIISHDVNVKNKVNDMIGDILYGFVVFLIDGENEGIVMPAQGWEERSISEPISEQVVRGPRESFNEAIMTNVGLLRRKIKSPNLRFKFREIGKETRTRVCISYLENVAEIKIVKEIEKRLDTIDIDGILEGGYIEELIRDEPLSPFATIGGSERPDTIAGKLLEGRVAIFVDGAPYVLTMPYVFIEYFQTNEDYYNGYMYSSFNRMLRLLGFFLSTSVPAIYVALVTFHQEMVPTPLILSISAARDGVPFPTIVEALLLLLAFELLREGGIRLPAPIGSTISFVGAIILGQAAVDAKFVSAPIVIITALTGITNFLLPNMIGPLNVVRLTFLILASFLGLYGYIFGVMGLIIHLVSMKSFGIPYMLDIGELKFQEVKDTAIRAPWWYMTLRPTLIGKKNRVRQRKKSHKKR